MAAPETAGKRIELEQKKQRILDLRKAGLTIRQIADREEIGKSQVHRHLKSMLREGKKLREETVEDLRELELMRLDRALQGIWPQIQNGGLGAIDRLVKLVERRAKLLGLDAPSKLAPTNPEGTESYDMANMTDEALRARAKELLERG